MAGLYPRPTRIADGRSSPRRHGMPHHLKERDVTHLESAETVQMPHVRPCLPPVHYTGTSQKRYDVKRASCDANILDRADEVSMLAERRYALETSPLFTGLPAPAIAMLETVSRRLIYRRGEVIFRQGEFGDTLHIIEHGKVKVTMPIAGGVDFVVDILGRGESFGELDLFEGHGRTSTLEALTDLETLAVPQPIYLQVARAYPEALERLLAMTAGRLRRAHELAAD